MQNIEPFSMVVKLTLDQVKRKMHAGEFSERGFARMAKVSQAGLNNILRGRRRPSIEMMDRICKAARVRPALTTIAPK